MFLYETDELNEMFLSLSVKLKFRDKIVDKYKSFSEFYNCVCKEFYHWVEYSHIKDFLTVVKIRKLKYFLDSQNSFIHMQYVDSIVATFKLKLISEINRFNGNNQSNILSDSEQGKLLSKLAKMNTGNLRGAVKFLMNQNMPNYSVEQTGYFIALTSEYQSYNEIENDIVRHKAVEIVEELRLVSDGINRDRVQQFGEIQRFKNLRNKEFDSLYSEKKDKFEALETECDDKIEDLEEKFNRKIDNLEELYSNRLKLKAPAQYWKKLEIRYFWEGFIWILLALISSLILVGFMYVILLDLPSYLKIPLDDFNAMSLKGTLVLAVITSIGVYLIRFFVKLALSAYHLSRDSKERHQLSYFYLALIKENAISEEDRVVVFNSLFRRADTGLIKGESSSIPLDSLVATVMKNIKSS